MKRDIMTGRLAYSQKLEKTKNQTITFNKKLWKGSYLVRIATANGSISKLLIVK